MSIKKKSNNTYYVKTSKRKTNFNRIVVQKVKYKVRDLLNFKLFGNLSKSNIRKNGGINEVCNR